jgi:large subunit ribosomal protein L28
MSGRKCQLTGKKANNGYTVSFSHKRVKHLQHANLQYKRVFWEREERWIRLRISTNAMKTIEKARQPPASALRRAHTPKATQNLTRALIALFRLAWRRWRRRRAWTCTACATRTPPSRARSGA